MIERTLCMIKPDAVRRNLAGPILSMIQESGLRVAGMKMLRLSRREAERFYEVRKGRPFTAALPSI